MAAASPGHTPDAPAPHAQKTSTSWHENLARSSDPGRARQKSFGGGRTRWCGRWRTLTIWSCVSQYCSSPSSSLPVLCSTSRSMMYAAGLPGTMRSLSLSHLCQQPHPQRGRATQSCADGQSRGMESGSAAVTKPYDLQARNLEEEHDINLVGVLPILSNVRPVATHPLPLRSRVGRAHDCSDRHG